MKLKVKSKKALWKAYENYDERMILIGVKYENDELKELEFQITPKNSKANKK